MPIYEYQCQSCQHRLEALQRISEPPLRGCPACGAPALRKMVSPVAFRLKGGGWYETDFKTGDRKNLAADKAPGDGGDAASGGKASSPDAAGASAEGSGGAAAAGGGDGAAKAAPAN